MQPTLFCLPFLRGNVKLLRYSGGNKYFKFGDIVHPLFTASNQCSRDNMPKTKTSALMNLHLESKALVSAHHACNNQMNKHDMVSSSAGPFQNMDDFAVLGLFKSMLSEPYPPNESICGLVLSYCLNTGHLLFGRQCQGHMLKSGFVHNRDMEVVDSSSNFGLDIHFYNLMFVKLIEEGYLNEALILLSRMCALDKVWNKATYIGIFGLCAGLKDLDLGRRFHNKLLRSCDVVDVSVCTEMIRMYGTCEDIVTAAKVFDMYEAGNGVIWTAMLAVLSQHQILEEVLDLFCDMHHEDVAPNESTFRIVLYASAGLESLRYGNLIHAVAHKTGFCYGPHKVVNHALINMYSRNGDIKAAERVFSCTTNNYRDIKTWNMMIDGYLFHGLGYKSLTLFKKMLKIRGKDPDTYTFGSVLTTCAHLGLVEKGYYYLYKLMKQKGVEPGLEHYMAIVDMLIKAGRLTEAIHFILSTPVKWSKYAWVALLRHCERHQKNSCHLFSLVAELIPIDMEIAVNEQYRIERFWDRQQPIRIELHGKCAMEMNKETLIFEMMQYGNEFLEMVHKVMGPLTTAPLKPRIDIFEEDYDDWNELEDITYHSEVVAVAYALLNTHPILPIRIIKIIGRICDSCHSLIKSVSKEHHRLIIVRDDHIWHNFQYGQCSCRDKW